MTDPTTRTACRIAGASLLLAFVILAFSTFALLDPILSDDAEATARSILANEATFRLGMIGNLLYGIGQVAFAAALFFVLQRADRTLAALASAFRLAWAFTSIVVVLDFVTVLRILEDPAVAASFGDRTAVIAALELPGYDVYYVGLPFWAVSATVMSWALYRGRLVPRWLALFGVVSAAWCVLCSIGHFIEPGFVNLWAYDTALALFELVLGGWLIVWGVRAETV